MTTLFVAQFAVPLALILLMALAPSRNHVLLRCANRDSGGGADALIGHLRSGSVQVRPGTTVAVGDWLGSVGNSGNTGEPHLHVHAQAPGPAGTPLGGDPLPILFNGRHPVRGVRIESP